MLFSIMDLLKFFRHATEPPTRSPVGSYSVGVVSLPEELDWPEFLPLELQYLMSRQPEVRGRLKELLAKGKAIGVRTVELTPEIVLRSVKHISFYSQHNCVLTWLPQLLRDKHLPTITAEDRQNATEHGADLDKDVKIILEHRLKFKRFVLIDEDNVGIGSEEQRFMTELSEVIYPVAIDHIVHRIVVDNANERTEIAQSIIKALLIIGPIAHVLEKWVSGFGKVFAASTDDLLGEAAEIMALRGSGFSWHSLRKRFILLVPVFAAATYGAFQVEPLLNRGFTVLGGAVFGLSAVALSLTTAMQSISMYRRSVQSLVQEGKCHGNLRNKSILWAAIVQDFTNPARLGLLIGAVMSPIIGIAGALLGVMHNGWALAFIGSTESVVAGLTVIFSNRINSWYFRRKLRSSLGITVG